MDIDIFCIENKILIKQLTNLERRDRMGESTQLLMCHVMHLYLQRSICLFKELDIHPGQAGLLWALNCKDQDHRGMAQKELAKHIGVKLLRLP